MGVYCGDPDWRPQGHELGQSLGPYETFGNTKTSQMWILLSRETSIQPFTHQSVLTEQGYCATLCYRRELSRRKKRPVPQGISFLGLL